MWLIPPIHMFMRNSQHCFHWTLGLVSYFISHVVVLIHAVGDPFCTRLEQFQDNEFVSVVDFIEGLGAMVMNEQNDSTIHRASVVGEKCSVSVTVLCTGLHTQCPAKLKVPRQDCVPI